MNLMIEEKGIFSLLMLREYLPATLQSEGYLHIANGITLAINSTDANAPGLWTIAGQLRYIVGYFASGITFTLPINVLDILDKTNKIGYNKLLAEGLGYQHNILGHHTVRERKKRKFKFGSKYFVWYFNLRFKCFPIKILCFSRGTRLII